MRFENTQVSGFEAAFRGARNPKNSWNLSDSYFGLVDINADVPDIEITDIADKWVQFSHPELDWPNVFTDKGCDLTDKYAAKLYKNGTLRFDEKNEIIDAAYIGPKDMKLAQTLIKAGPEHRKFLRQIFVSVDITAPLYIWKELDTYKIATVANSQSTMHKLDSKPITLDCFEVDDFEPDLEY